MSAAQNGKQNPEPKPTIAELEARIARTRLELTGTVDELTDRIHPKVQLERAKASMRARVKDFTDDLTSGDPRAILVVAGATAAAAGLALAVVLRRRR